MNDTACGKRGAPMSDEKCPFLEMTTVTYCKAFPVKKMIPLDRSMSEKGLCHTGNYRLCSAFRELEGPGTMTEYVRGFMLRPDYYFHPRHLWVAPGKESETEAKVGADDFSQRLVGKIDRISLPPEGSSVKENSVCFLLHSGDRTARMVAPGDAESSARSTRKWSTIRQPSTAIPTKRGGSSRCSSRGNGSRASITEAWRGSGSTGKRSGSTGCSAATWESPRRTEGKPFRTSAAG